MGFFLRHIDAHLDIHRAKKIEKLEKKMDELNVEIKAQSVKFFGLGEVPESDDNNNHNNTMDKKVSTTRLRLGNLEQAVAGREKVANILRVVSDRLKIYHDAPSMIWVQDLAGRELFVKGSKRACFYSIKLGRFSHGMNMKYRIHRMYLRDVLSLDVDHQAGVISLSFAEIDVLKCKSPQQPLYKTMVMNETSKIPYRYELKFDERNMEELSTSTFLLSNLVGEVQANRFRKGNKLITGTEKLDSWVSEESQCGGFTFVENDQVKLMLVTQLQLAPLTA